MSSVKAATRRAAQKASSSRSSMYATVGVCGRHFLGSNTCLGLADRVLDVVDRLPRAQAEAKREKAFREARLHRVFVAHVPLVIVVTHAEVEPTSCR